MVVNRTTTYRIAKDRKQWKEWNSLNDQIIKKYIPMTETTYYTLLALNEPRHGYAIMQFISELTKKRIQMGTGTLYTMLGRLVEDKLINIVAQDSIKKVYQITEEGNELIKKEIDRLTHQLENGEQIYGK